MSPGATSVARASPLGTSAGSTSGPGVEVHTRHRFTSGYIQTWWRILPQGSHDPHDASLLFPSTGDDVTVTAVLRNGQELAIGRDTAVRLVDIAWLHIGGAKCGYVIVPRSRALPGRARLVYPRAQASAPEAGPTVRFELIHNGRLRSLTASVRIAPARDLHAARSVATALGADPV